MDEQNPYRQPDAEAAPASRFFALVLSAPRRRPMVRALVWWGQAWKLFWRRPLGWLVAAFAWWLVVMVVQFVSLVIPFLGSVVVFVLMPVFGAGLLQLAHTLNRGEGLYIGDIFAGFHYKAGPLCGVGVLFLVLMIGIFVVPMGTGLILFSGDIVSAVASDGQAASAAPDNMADQGMSLRAGVWALTFMATLVVAGAMVGFAPALVYFTDIDPGRALVESLKAVLLNILPFTVYGIVLIALSLMIIMTPLLLFFLLDILGVVGLGFVELQDTGLESWLAALGAWVVALMFAVVLGYLWVMVMVTLSIYTALRDIFPGSEPEPDSGSFGKVH